MLAAMSGHVINNSIVVDGDLKDYEGMSLVVTFLKERTQTPPTKPKIDFSKYGHWTERGQNVEKYMEEIRGNDRI